MAGAALRLVFEQRLAASSGRGIEAARGWFRRGQRQLVEM